MGQGDDGGQLVQGEQGHGQGLFPGQAALLVEQGGFGGGEGQRWTPERGFEDGFGAYRLPSPEP